jgi:hypothetical protein
MKKQLNHSRYIDNGARDIGNAAYHRARTTPTEKQLKFYRKLYAMCRENAIDAATHHEHTRSGVAQAIDKLIARLKENGIDVKGNGKSADYILCVGEDIKGRDYGHEVIRVKDTPAEDPEIKLCVKYEG